MLDLRPNCEHCGKNLPNTSTDAMICSFECTYCADCAIRIFENVCPSCSGNFEKRPIRPSKSIQNHPASAERVFAPKDLEKARRGSAEFKNVNPEKR